MIVAGWFEYIGLLLEVLFVESFYFAGLICVYGLWVIII